MTSKAREFPTPAVSLTAHPATLPEAEISDGVDHVAVARSAIAQLARLDTDCLASNAIWRDTLALTGTLRTFFSPALISDVWTPLARKHRPNNFELIVGSSRVARFGPKAAWVEARFSFELDGERAGRCSGILGVVPSLNVEGRTQWQIWLLCTILEQPLGFPDVDKLEPVPCSPAESTQGHPDQLGSRDLDCVVVGAAMGGLCMAARLKALGLSYIVVDKHDDIGDTWVKDRYDSVKLHTSKAYSQMPGYPQTFGLDDPYHLTGRDLRSGFQRFVKTFGIKVKTSTTLSSAEWNEESSLWVLSLQTRGKPYQLRAKHIVLAVGNNGITPNIPPYANRNAFKGDIVHGASWKNGEHWSGKSGVVVGAANTAHDVILDMAKAQFRAITMIQRSPTLLLPTSTFSGLVDPVFNEQTPLELSDRMLHGYPLAIQRLMAMAGIRAMADTIPEYFDRIEAQGFRGERQVKVRSALPVSYTETGLLLNDGTRLDADVIVFATGYAGNMKTAATQIFGEEIASTLQEFWQCDEEGEIRGAWKDTGNPRIWYTGHGFAHARYYARFIAMQIKAAVDGNPMEMYTETPII
ncbi:hypothetical protein LTR56_004479 [Elasticomyces elasticus]|nr:hypothetical protein LTR56_004479 [Elasticomyces elasticus]KAK3654212.1 hypothetical protein LTR22_010838 [Elasticomyces elasticus]KAK4920014.1 hypothetical protein LTR49_012452 [Elasticomyces elasticus]KAK5758848.1 hypothetical protein LTS12_011089 [Elasticomyces elasticus]